jgi:SAM-dependent methyltransferase
MTRCQICGSSDIRTFLSRTGVPVHQNLLMADAATARSIARGDLAMGVCESCGFVSNRAFDDRKLSYSDQYDNTQSCSPFFDSYLDGLVSDLVVKHGVRNCNVVEVGCGKGQFLRKLVTYPFSGNRGFGFDPSYVGPLSDLEGRLTFNRCNYDDSCTGVPADFVVCRHVIEHIPDPLILLRSVRSALRLSSGARVFFETPCVEWILQNNVIWDFFYEHCSLFSASSLTFSFEQAGFTVKNVQHIFGDQYLWLEAEVDASRSASRPHSESSLRVVEMARQFGALEVSQRREWLSRVEALCRRGKVALWGAGAKGVTFANLLDPDCTQIDCVVDINPNKQNRYVPGTAHPIVHPHTLPQRRVSTAVLMNPNYREENQRLLEEAGIKVDLVDWN